MRESEFLSILQNTESGKEYTDLILSCKNRSLDRQSGYEIHHIHPRGLGGKDIPSNTVKLSVYEHCLAHLYLARAIPCSYTLKPIIRMSSSQYSKLSDLDKLKLDEIYSWASLREKAIHCKHSAAQSLHISQARKGQLCNNLGTQWMHKENVNKRVPDSDISKYLHEGWLKGRKIESCINISKAKKGQPSPRKGVKLSADICNKLSRSHKGHKSSEEAKRKRSKALRKFYSEHPNYLKGRNKGTVWVHKNTSKIRIRTEDLQKYIQEGYKQGMKS